MDFKNLITTNEYNNENYINNTLDNLLENVDIDKTKKEELYERTLISNFLDENACVLEIGGGLGYVSKTIKNKLKNNNHVIIEPNVKKANNLKEKGYNVFPGVISNRNLYFQRNNKEYYYTNYIPNLNSILINNITNVKNLKKNFNINFDTIIADCEGALPQIMLDNPELYNCKMIILEYDWYFKSCTNFRNLLIKNYNFKSLYQLPLHWKPSKGKGCLNEENKLIGHEVLIKNNLNN